MLPGGVTSLASGRSEKHERAIETGLLRPEPLPGAYTVANVAGFEAITHYSSIEL